MSEYGLDLFIKLVQANTITTGFGYVIGDNLPDKSLVFDVQTLIEYQQLGYTTVMWSND